MPPRNRPLILTVGDPAGIGPEVLVGALLRLAPGFDTPLTCVCPRPLLEEALERLAAGPEARDAVRHRLDRQVRFLVPPSAPAAVRGKWVAEQVPFLRESLELALTEAARTGAGIVTGPADKRFFVALGLHRAGHTEYLARHFAAPDPLMLFEAEGLRVAVLTRHIPLAEVSSAATQETLARAARLAWAHVRERSVGPPRPLVVAGLDPHCGEWGAFSDRDLQVREWVAALRGESVAIEGPVAADTLFVEHRLRDYSAVLCWYHDQGMIPIKLLRFASAVNVTLGLPVVRTSPAHGVAYDIAWTGRADAGSYAAAMEVAAGGPLRDPARSSQRA